MKYNRRLNADQIEGLKKKKRNKKANEKFNKFRCLVCGKKTRHHHNFCDKHYHLQSL